VKCHPALHSVTSRREKKGGETRREEVVFTQVFCHFLWPEEMASFYLKI
jgi:hypothetical protein